MISDILIADITHTSRGINSHTFPLGAAYVASYAKKSFGSRYNIKLFKFPNTLINEIQKTNKPLIIGFSCYSWNLELSYEICKFAKELNKDTIVIFGGPNFPLDVNDKKSFLEMYKCIDFYIQGEGEEGFVNLIQNLETYNYDVYKLKHDKKSIVNCVYIDSSNELNLSPTKRIEDLSILESPYLSGFLDEFFEYKLIPLLQTNRGCPFSCLYCTDGIKIKNKVTKFPLDTIKRELEYISTKIKYSDILTIVDLNYAMYDEDIKIAEIIIGINKRIGWPKLLDVAPGKNRKDIIRRVVKTLEGIMTVGASIQSSDDEVLRNIKRKNISLDTYKDFIAYNKQLYRDSWSYTDIILNLPGDTQEKHFQSIKYAIMMGVDNVKLFQAIMLLGSELELQNTRNKYQIKTMYRMIPGCIGEYEFGNKKVNIVELEEIIIETNTMSKEDYINCRIMDLLVESYYNGALLEELFKIIDSSKVFDIICHLYNHLDYFPIYIREIIDSYRKVTLQYLFKTKESAKEFLFRNINSIDIGRNELFEYKYLLYKEMKVLIDVFMNITKDIVDCDEEYLDNLRNFIIDRKESFWIIKEPVTDIFTYSIDTIEKKLTRYKFYHTNEQQKDITLSMNMWGISTRGIPGMLQKSNVKKMYRTYEAI